MSISSRWLAEVMSILQAILDTQGEKIIQVAERVADTIQRDKVVHMFGSGHSNMIVQEAFSRAGGLAAVNPLLEQFLTPLNSGKSGKMERLSGLGEIIFQHYEVQADEVLFVVSNSGINAVPVDMAIAGKEAGLFVVGIMSLQHSRSIPSRHPSGMRLCDVADIVIDNCGKPGDAALHLESTEVRVAPTSTIAGCFIINSIVAEAVGILVQHGISAPVFLSANIQGGDDFNKQLRAKYRQRVRLL